MNLYLRLLLLLLRLRWVPRRGVLDAARLSFRVWPNDCDFNMHMNNGRYLTFMDLGRLHLIAQAGLLGALWRRRWSPVLAAAEISYVRPLLPLQRFDLETRILSWDEKYFYLEQRFFAHGHVCAHALVKGLFVGRSGKVATAQALAEIGVDMAAPAMGEELRLWSELVNVKKQKH
ncbi:MAG: thioesterase family protein [Pseudomonadota bacterium]